jgi:hypothetical protein
MGTPKATRVEATGRDVLSFLWFQMFVPVQQLIHPASFRRPACKNPEVYRRGARSRPPAMFVFFVDIRATVHRLKDIPK